MPYRIKALEVNMERLWVFVAAPLSSASTIIWNYPNDNDDHHNLSICT